MRLAGISAPTSPNLLSVATLPVKPVRELALQNKLVLQVLQLHGDLTTHEIARHCMLTPHEIGKRLSELERATLAHRCVDGEGNPVKRKSPSGVGCTVWSAT